MKTISITLRNLAKANRKKEFMELLQKENVIQNLNQQTPYGLSNIIDAFNRLNIENKKQWRYLSNNFYVQLNNMSIGDILLSTSAFAQKNHESINWKDLEELLLKRWEELNNKDQIIFIPYIFSKNKKGSEKFWTALEKDITTKTGYLGETCMVNNIWAFSSMKKGNEQFWHEIKIALLKKVRSYKIYNLSKIMFSLSTIPYDMKAVQQKIIEVFQYNWVQKNQTMWEGKNLAFVFFAQDNMRITDTKILQFFSDAVLYNIQRLKLYDLLKIFHSIDRLDYVHGQLQEAFVDRLDGFEDKEFEYMGLNEIILFMNLSERLDFGAILAKGGQQARSLSGEKLGIIYGKVRLLFGVNADESGLSFYGKAVHYYHHLILYKKQVLVWDGTIESIYMKEYLKNRDQGANLKTILFYNLSLLTLINEPEILPKVSLEFKRFLLSHFLSFTNLKILELKKEIENNRLNWNKSAMLEFYTNISLEGKARKNLQQKNKVPTMNGFNNINKGKPDIPQNDIDAGGDNAAAQLIDDLESETNPKNHQSSFDSDGMTEISSLVAKHEQNDNLWKIGLEINVSKYNKAGIYELAETQEYLLYNIKMIVKLIDIEVSTTTKSALLKILEDWKFLDQFFSSEGDQHEGSENDTKYGMLVNRIVFFDYFYLNLINLLLEFDKKCVEQDHNQKLLIKNSFVMFDEQICNKNSLAFHNNYNLNGNLMHKQIKDYFK